MNRSESFCIGSMLGAFAAVCCIYSAPAVLVLALGAVCGGVGGILMLIDVLEQRGSKGEDDEH